MQMNDKIYLGSDESGAFDNVLNVVLEEEANGDDMSIHIFMVYTATIYEL